MSENGHTREQGIRDRFFALLRPLTKTRAPEVPPEPTEEQKLVLAVRSWAADAPDAFLQALDRWVAEAHANVKTNFRDHPMSAYAIGFEDCIEQLRDRFRQWRGELSPSGESPQRSESGG